VLVAGIEHIEAWVCIAVAVVFALVALITAGRRKVLPGLVLSVTLLAAGPYLHDGHYPGDLYGDRVVLKHHGPDLLDQYRSVRHVYQVGIACGADDSSAV
jgi:hypothetical protein